MKSESKHSLLSHDGNRQLNRAWREKLVFLTHRYSQAKLHIVTEAVNSPQTKTAMPTYVEALWDHTTLDDNELPFQVGDVIRVRVMADSEWWWGETNGSRGWFPVSFVEESTESSIDQIYGRRSIAKLNHKELALKDIKPKFKIKKRLSHIVSSLTAMNKGAKARVMLTNVVQEIMKAESNYLKQLSDIVKGYLRRCEVRNDMFNEDSIRTIFSNVEEIYEFEKEFLGELKASINENHVHKSNIAAVFLKNRKRFGVYLEYCSNHQESTSKVSELLSLKRYRYFFEACRLLQRMIEIPIDGFLLSPVQKICKYPLQLSELLKYTDPDDPNYETVSEAVEAMTDVTRMINEHKRHVEGMENIALWQKGVLNWQGDDMLEKSTRLIHSGEVHVATDGDKAKPQPRVMFLFDHQLVLCKKDYMRKDLYLKLRMDTDKCNVIDQPTAEPESPWKHSWKIQTTNSTEILTCACKDEGTKLGWMKAFQEERAESSNQKKSRIILSENAKKKIAHNASVKSSTLKRSNSLKRYVPLKRTNSLKRSQTLKLARGEKKRLDLNMTI